MKTRDIPVEDIIRIFNDNLDTNYFPIGQIAEIDDDEHWDKVGRYLEGSTFAQMMRNGIPEGTKWFAVDTDANEIYWFSSKKAILDLIGEEDIQSYYEEEISEI